MTERPAPSDAVVIERTFSASAATVWQMWTDPAHFSAWYGPTGASIRVARMNVRVGGKRLVCMEMDTPSGPMRMWFTGEFRSVVEAERLVYTESMSDEHGNVLTPEQAGLPAGHPAVTEVTVELKAAGDKTRMVMTHVGVPADSPGAAGWQLAFDKLAAHLDLTT